MAGNSGRKIICFVLLIGTIVQHASSARPLQQETPGVEGAAGLLRPAVVHVDVRATAFGDGAAGQGGDADIAVPYEDKRLSPGGPDPQHH
ncbi:hypothetical protein HU200_026752 [Digitaria exilis]|uniref:Uncharacterized protein n=1 Tax=Digitaria exilis TaxID=1010633 RepID=A0A835C2J4_9POAL|nr:hypothetical protein HU200_026752 [Digitaria exilis]